MRLAAALPAAPLAAALLAAALLAACSTALEVIDAADAGDAAPSTPVVDGAPEPPPQALSECDEQDDCAACTTCSLAPFDVCWEYADACERDVECAALQMCLRGCGEGDVECMRACGGSHPGGIAAVLELHRCVWCTACLADCHGGDSVWCIEPPF
jgi:hypothetical protein